MRATLTTGAPPGGGPLDGRAARRVDGMRRVQAAALDLFEERGFDRVTVEDIARKAGVGPASVYRYFATKERIVLWDEYDPALFVTLEQEIAKRGRGSTLDAVERGIVSALEDVYARDRARILRRARLMMATPQLIAASASDRAALRAALVDVLATGKRASLRQKILAGAIAVTLEACVDEWVRGKGKPALGELLKEGFRHLRDIAAPRT
jgi:AcrR family transcriptional regulator